MNETNRRIEAKEVILKLIVRILLGYVITIIFIDGLGHLKEIFPIESWSDVERIIFILALFIVFGNYLMPIFNGIGDIRWHEYPKKEPEFGTYVVTTISKDGSYKVSIDEYDMVPLGFKRVDDLIMGWKSMSNIIAWSVLPDPFIPGKSSTLTDRDNK